MTQQKKMSPQSAVSDQPWLVLVDGTALYLAQRAVDPTRNMDYPKLVEILSEKAQLPWPPKAAYFFTALDETNDRQIKFNDMIKGLGFTVRTKPPSKANIVNKQLTEAPQIIRFDGVMSFVLGRTTSTLSQPEKMKLFIVSDSWGLSDAVLDCVGRNIQVTLCFFMSYLDTRWLEQLRNAKENGWPLKFVDLEEYKLFDRPRPDLRKEKFMIDLPPME
jgi:hypothetical protein